MFSEQGDFVAGVRIVEPDTDVTGHRQPCAIGRIDRRFRSSFT